jgi:CO/xanthine dehydrogenase FAD-binding subunit
MMALEIVRVDSVRTAAAVLVADAGARFIGGGTLAVRDVNYGDGSTRKLILPDGLALEGISIAGGRVTIGAAATMAQIARHADLAFLAPVAASIGGPAVRAMATLGGNLFAPYPFGDFAVSLLALGATLTIVGAQKSETIEFEKFIGGNGAPTGIVVSASFMEPPAGAFRFTKVTRRKPHGASVLSIAAVLPMRERKVTGARVAYGAMAPRPMRARAVEQTLEGNLLDAATIAAAINAASEGCAPLTDPQASDWYRLQILPVHLQRLLEA